MIAVLRWGRPTLVAAFLAACAACGPGDRTGPGEVSFDRDVCEHCQMVISERPYAVQVRDGSEHKLHSFDDLGCAVAWLATSQPEAAGDGWEMWVRAPKGTGWIDARTVRFSAGHRTPMGYGFSVVAGEPAGSLDLADVMKQIHAGRDERRRAED